MADLYNKLQEYRREQFNRCIMAGHEQFFVRINGEEFLFDINADCSGYGWWCVVPGMYEPGNSYGAYSMKSREDAALKLVEQIEEHIAETA